MSNSGKQAFCGEEGNMTPLKSTAWEAIRHQDDQVDQLYQLP